MAKMNLFLSLNSYLDTNASNNPSLNIIKWARDFQGFPVDKPQSSQISLAPGETKDIFDGSRTLQHDNTTEYELTLKAGTLSTYVLKCTSGTAPEFRAARTTGADATTQITVTKNGNVFTFSSVGGTPLNLNAGGVVVGDRVAIGSVFSTANRGTFSVIGKTATSFSVENPNGEAEGPVTLGVNFADQIKIYGSAGVQVGDIVRIFGGFSPATQNSYEITAVQDDQIEFYSTAALPSETVVTDSISIYGEAKKMIYIESDKKLSIGINGLPQGQVEPLVSGTEVRPGMMLKSEIVWSLSVTNSSLETASVFVASVE